MDHDINRPSDSDLSFVARRYSRGAFSPRRAWRKISSGHGLRPRRLLPAAAILGGVILAASAATVAIYRTSHPAGEQPDSVATAVAAPPATAPAATARIRFADRPLSEAAAEIERVYGIRLDSLPSGNPAVTLSYEGDAVGAVDLLNESLDAHIVIRK